MSDQCREKSLGGLRSNVSTDLQKLTDCNWSSCPTRASAGPTVFSETSGGVYGGATGPMPQQPVITSLGAS